jgi:uncharacterized membrane protein
LSPTILAISLFFHILATVVWIGGLLFTVLLVWPEVQRTLKGHPELYALLARIRKRFTPAMNLSLAVLIVTGLTQMAGDPNYDGMMQINNDWSRVILVKHIAFVVLIISGAVIQFAVTPALERATLRLERGKGGQGEWERLRRREVMLSWFNLSLGILIIGFSVWASVL